MAENQPRERGWDACWSGALEDHFQIHLRRWNITEIRVHKHLKYFVIQRSMQAHGEFSTPGKKHSDDEWHGYMEGHERKVLHEKAVSWKGMVPVLSRILFLTDSMESAMLDNLMRPRELPPVTVVDMAGNHLTTLQGDWLPNSFENALLALYSLLMRMEEVEDRHLEHRDHYFLLVDGCGTVIGPGSLLCVLGKGAPVDLTKVVSLEWQPGITNSLSAIAK